MKISINPLNSTPTNNNWQVQLNDYAVRFQSEDAAKNFVQRLQQRLAQPHTLPLGHMGNREIA